MKLSALFAVAALSITSAHAGTYSTSIGYELNDSAQQQIATSPIGPFYVQTTLTGIQLSISMAASPTHPLEEGFSEALITLSVTGSPGAPSFQIGSGPTGIFHGGYTGGGGAIASHILKTWYSKHGDCAVNQALYIPLNGLVIPAGQSVLLYIGTMGLPSDIEVQGTLQYCQ